MRKLSAALALGAVVVLGGAGAAWADEVPAHQVLVCKYVGTPGVDERLQTGQNPIVVDTHALDDGFSGVFPYTFQDAQGNSIAIRYLAEGESPGDVFDISECPGGGSPSPTPSPTPTESPSASPSTSPAPSASGSPTSRTSTPVRTRSTRTPSGPAGSPARRLALTGGQTAAATAACLGLLLLGSIALRLGSARRRGAGTGA